MVIYDLQNLRGWQRFFLTHTGQLASTFKHVATLPLNVPSSLEIGSKASTSKASLDSSYRHLQQIICEFYNQTVPFSKIPISNLFLKKKIKIKTHRKNPQYNHDLITKLWYIAEDVKSTFYLSWNYNWYTQSYNCSFLSANWL